MINFTSQTWALLVALSLTWFQTSAAAKLLQVGDPAPALQTGKWIQGEPVKEFTPGKAYIVEFWATWCGPCRVSIPHLNEIANRFKDKGLIVIGQDCWEEDESAVAPFVKKMGSKMTYRVALDDKSGSPKGKMAATWMEAAGQNGIPTAFLVDLKGRIAWIGHPMELKESVIEEVLAGKYDLQKAAASFQEQKEQESRLNEGWKTVQAAIKAKDWKLAGERLDEFSKLLPEDQRSNLDRIRMNILIGQGDLPAAYRLATQLAAQHPDDAMYQNDLAWQLVTDPAIQKPDLSLAEKFAKRGNELSDGKNPAILDTLARIYFLQGKKTEAVALQEKAVGLAEEALKDNLEKTLASYRQDKLPQ